MRVIEGTLTDELKSFIGSNSVDKAQAYPIRTYRELITQVAQLAYLNKDHLLFFRGQAADYKNRAGASTFYPNIYRGDYLPQREVHHKFDILNQASRLLVDAFTKEKIHPVEYSPAL